MRWTTWVSLVVSLGPVVVFLIAGGWELWELPGFLALLTFPYLAVALTAWIMRREARTSFIIMMVALLITALGIACHLNLFGPWLSLLTPLIQFLILLAGGLVSGMRREAHLKSCPTIPPQQS